MRSFCKKTYDFIIKYGIYIYAALVVLLNVSLIFDHVVWGDEAFSATAVQNDLKGIFQISYYSDCHPPLSYLWMRLFYVLFGDALWALHLSSVVCFAIGVVLCATIGKKLFGNLPAFLFITLSGLSKTCAEYNQEIRMYAICFFCITLVCFMISKILSNQESKAAWIFMTAGALLAAYSHYYGLMTAGLLVFFTAFFYWLFHKEKRYKGLISLACFVLLYLPWLPMLFHQMGSVENNWWNDKNPPLWDLLRVVMFSERLRFIMLPAFLVILILSAIFCVREYNKKHEFPVLLRVALPMLCTILFVFLAGYLLGALLNPILVARYLYPLCPLVLFVFMSGICYLIMQKKAYQIAFWVFACLIFGISILDFKEYRSTCKVEETVTNEFLDLVGTPDEHTAFMSTGVPHLSWTVLPYYYPNQEVLGIAGAETEEVSDDVTTLWRLRADEEPWSSIHAMEERGYTVEDLGVHYLGKYTFLLYRYTK